METPDTIPLAGSFRDPSGFVFARDGEIYRQVNDSYRENYELLKSSGLYDTLVSRGLLVPHDEVDVAAPDPSRAYKVLRPERIGFISYPYEWCFSELNAAALLTLEVQKEALAHGMSLQDASAYNVQFVGCRPVLIDTLSFENTREGRPWSGYGQFCRHFLGPLALMAYRDPRLISLLRAHVDGVPLDLVDRLLPWSARRRPSLYIHIRAHAKAAATGGGKKTRSRSFGARAFEALLESLRSAVSKLDAPSNPSGWSEYYSEAEHYSSQAFDEKKAFVAAAIERTQPKQVWDLGANVGVFGRIAGDRGIPTVCFEMDHACVEATFRTGAERGDRYVLPLRLDLTNPSPALGWAHRERASLAQRGPADLALALALIHHLAIGNNVPLPDVAAFFSQIAKSVVVEFVPKSDPKVQSLLSVRDDIFVGYHRSGFEQAFARRFDILATKELPDSERVLYLLAAKT